jgi:hypothetical protein
MANVFIVKFPETTMSYSFDTKITVSTLKKNIAKDRKLDVSKIKLIHKSVVLNDNLILGKEHNVGIVCFLGKTHDDLSTLLEEKRKQEIVMINIEERHTESKRVLQELDTKIKLLREKNNSSDKKKEYSDIDNANAEYILLLLILNRGNVLDVVTDYFNNELDKISYDTDEEIKTSLRCVVINNLKKCAELLNDMNVFCNLINNDEWAQIKHFSTPEWGFDIGRMVLAYRMYDSQVDRMVSALFDKEI